MSNILYISMTGMTEALGETQVIQYLLELSKSHSIHLFSFEKPTKQKKYDDVSSRLIKAGISWSFLKYSNQFGIISSAYQIIIAILKLKKIIKKNNIQIIHCRSLIPAFIGMFLKKISGKKLLFDIRGFAIDEKIMERRLKENSLLTKLLKKIESYVYRKADHVVTLTHISKPIITEYYGVNKNHITVIPTCANADLFYPANKINNFKQEMGYKQNEIIFLRSGSINEYYDVDAEFKLFEQLIKIDQLVQLLILNQGQHDLIINYLSKYSIPTSKYKIFSVNIEEVGKYLNIIDACVFFIKPTFAKLATAPTKFAELVCTEVPSITNTKYGDIDYYLGRYNAGLLFDLDAVHADPKKTAGSVLNYLQQPKDKNSYHKLFSEHFSKYLAVKRYNEIYALLAS